MGFTLGPTGFDDVDEIVAIEDELEAIHEKLPVIEEGDAGKVLTVDDDEEGASWQTPSGGLPEIHTTDAGYTLLVNDSGTACDWKPEKQELPTIASGDAGKVLAVNSLENGVEWKTIVAGTTLYHAYGTKGISGTAPAVDLSANCFEISNFGSYALRGVCVAPPSGFAYNMLFGMLEIASTSKQVWFSGRWNGSTLSYHLVSTETIPTISTVSNFTLGSGMIDVSKTRTLASWGAQSSFTGAMKIVLTFSNGTSFTLYNGGTVNTSSENTANAHYIDGKSCINFDMSVDSSGTLRVVSTGFTYTPTIYQALNGTITSMTITALT